jgi:hypothetical protein
MSVLLYWYQYVQIRYIHVYKWIYQFWTYRSCCLVLWLCLLLWLYLYWNIQTDIVKNRYSSLFTQPQKNDFNFFLCDVWLYFIGRAASSKLILKMHFSVLQILKVWKMFTLKCKQLMVFSAKWSNTSQHCEKSHASSFFFFWAFIKVLFSSLDHFMQIKNVS